MDEVIIEGGKWAIDWVGYRAGNRIQNKDPNYYIDLDMDLLNLFPINRQLVLDFESNESSRSRLMENITRRLHHSEEQLEKSQDKHVILKTCIGVLKFVLPAAVCTGAIFIPVKPGAIALAAVAWKVGNVLEEVHKMKTAIDNLTISDYKTTMILFKDDILVPLECGRYPKKEDVKVVSLKALDVFNKLKKEDIECKIELIKVRMFCIVYAHFYDERAGLILPYHRISEEDKRIIRVNLQDRLKDLDHIAAVNRVEHYSEKSFTKKEKHRNQEILDTIDHIKKTSYCLVTIQDTVVELNNLVVKIWSLKSFMVPEGEEDKLFSARNEVIPWGPNFMEQTIQASVFKDKQMNWKLQVHIPSFAAYEDLVIYCEYQKEGSSVIFVPTKEKDNSWSIHTSYLSEDGILSFYIVKPRVLNLELDPYEIPRALNSFRKINLFQPDSLKLLRNGFEACHDILEKSESSVITTIGFMNLTKASLRLTHPVFKSGQLCSENPWKQEFGPWSLNYFVCQKKKLGIFGSTGATMITLGNEIQVIFYWNTPYKDNWNKNCWGIGFINQKEFSYQSTLSDWIDDPPQSVPYGITLKLYNAKDGPVGIDLSEKWRFDVRMTTSEKSCIKVIVTYKDQQIHLPEGSTKKAYIPQDPSKDLICFN